MLIIKVLMNIDALSKDNATDLKILARSLGGAPLLIGARSISGQLEDGIIYLRYGIPIMSIPTLNDYFIEGVPPLIYAAPGGFYVEIDAGILKELRKQRRLSIGHLAEIAGVSRKAIQMYENGMNAKVEVAVRLEEFLNEPIVVPLDPFTHDPKLYEKDIEQAVNLDTLTGTEREVYIRLKEIGYEVIPTIKCPFDALTKDSRNLIITGVGKYDKATLHKARTMTNISKITERYAVFFIEKRIGKQNLEGTPLIRKDELKEIGDSEEILRLICERK